MSFIKILSRLAKLKYSLLVLSLIVVIPFTLFPILSSSHLPIISDAWSATYYVDATGGNDGNSGISLSTSWKTIAKVNASRFNPGDQILFKRGEIWREQLVIPSSGSSGNYLTFADYGSGTGPIISGADIPAPWTQTLAANTWEAYCKLEPSDVFFGSTQGTRVSSPSKLNTASKWYWTNSYLYVYSTSNPGSSIKAYVRDHCVFSNQKDYIKYQNLILENSTDIALYHTNSTGMIADTLLIRYTGYQHDNVWPCGIQTDHVGSVLIKNCEGDHVTWTAFAVYNFMGSGPIDNVIMERNTAHHGGHNGLDAMGGTAGNLTGLIMRYNLSYNNASNGIYLVNVTGRIVSPQIYYNVIYNNNDSGIQVSISSGQPIINGAQIYNNVLYANGQAGYGPGIDLEYATEATIKNNICFNNNVRGIAPSEIRANDWGGAANNCDYNLVYNELYSDIYKWNTNTYNFSRAQSRGIDAHGFNLNPRFVEPGTDFHFQSSSPCIGAGINVGLTMDFDKRTVPLGKGVNIGAYQLGLAPPKNLRII